MIVRTVFQREQKYQVGEVEVQLLPGVPQLHLVGLPDASMRECGIKIKSALRACDLKWPSGHQIVVNLRPAYQRKASSGVDLAIALAILAQTDQLSEKISQLLKTSAVYGEVTLDGRICAPPDAAAAMRSVGIMLTGPMERETREGQWYELASLSAQRAELCTRQFDWSKFWQRPELPEIEVHKDAARALVLATHLGLSTLVVGPQGSGKSTWARALFALSPEPDLSRMQELADLFGQEVSRWRPCEQPHHTTPARAMVGCGVPPRPGVISRSHGGVLILDEFLEFHPEVLEALREPVESGVIEVARGGRRVRFPAAFQLVATSNLCPCGRLNPSEGRKCSHSLLRCRSVCARLSGPVLDRFEMVLLSHEWLNPAASRLSLRQVAEWIERTSRFAQTRGQASEALPEYLALMPLSHRRRKAMLRMARGLADMAESVEVREEHVFAATDLALSAAASMAALFA